MAEPLNPFHENADSSNLAALDDHRAAIPSGPTGVVELVSTAAHYIK